MSTLSDYGTRFLSTVLWSYTRPSVYIFTVSGVTVTPTEGAVYTNNGETFTVITASITAGSGTVTASGTGDPGSLFPEAWIKSSGTGDATIVFSAWADSDLITLTLSPGIVGCVLKQAVKASITWSVDNVTFSQNVLHFTWPDPVFNYNPATGERKILFEPDGINNKNLYIRIDGDGTVEGAFYFNSRIHPTHTITTAYSIHA